MTAQLGTHHFTAHLGEPPQLPRSAVETFRRPGQSQTGAKVHGSQSPEHQITLVAHVAEANRATTMHGYRATVGTIVNLILGGTNYGTGLSMNFLVVDVQVMESRAIPRFIGIVNAVAVDYSPAGRIVSQWTLVAVPT